MADDELRIIRMTLEYDGTDYAGWQRQDNCKTVQQTIENALASRLNEPIQVIASGRTDSGVHAMGQVISFSTSSTIDAKAIGKGLFRYLPRDISIIETRDAPAGFDARRSARMRWYRFMICNRSPRPAVGNRYLTHIHQRLDFDLMNEAAALFTGDHDFTAFRSSKCTAPRTVLTMQPITITQLPENIVQFDFKCRSFLHNMVRILTGTLISVGKGRLTIHDVKVMLETRNRHLQAVTVLPNGLCLYRVLYDEDMEPLEDWVQPGLVSLAGD